MEAVVGADPGPLARLEAVVARPETVGVVFQRVCEGETLKAIARAWGVPVGRFTEWYLTEHGDRYDAALKVLADQKAHEALEIADGSDAEGLGPAKLQVDTRKWASSRWDRARYGEHVTHQVNARAVLRVDFSRPGEKVVNEVVDVQSAQSAQSESLAPSEEI